jgi:prepilin-type N-terminal cleavage/methylation domain-containing protein
MTRLRLHELRRHDGFTLVETLIAMTMFLLVLMAIFQLFDPSQATYLASTRKMDAQQNARVAMDTLIRQIRMTGYFPENVATPPANPQLTNSVQTATNTTLSVYGDLDGSGASNVFTFCLDSGGIRRVKGAQGNAASYTCANGDVLAEAVTGLSFAYFDANDTPVPNPPTAPFQLDTINTGVAPTFVNVAQRSIVRRVVITLTAQEASGAGTQVYTLTSDVRFRNP